MNTVGAIQTLYDQNLFLQAYRQSAPYWRRETDLKALSLDALILGTRLAQRLGSFRLSRWLAWHAFLKEPRNPRVRYYALHSGRRKADCYDILYDYERRPDLDTDDPELRASWHASRAVTWASVYDFDNAHQCLEKSRAIASNNSWLFSCETEVYLLDDQWDKALAAIEQAWQLDPGRPYVVYGLGHVLMKLGRLAEAVQRIAPLAAKSESFEFVNYYGWLIRTWGETLEGEKRQAALSEAKKVIDKLPELAPLPDRETRDLIARARLDLADLADDQEEMRHWAEQTRSPYYHKVLENLRQNPDGNRIRLPFRRVSQKYETCLPSSIAAALSALAIEVNEDEIASEITYGGTQIWAAEEWLEKRGLTVRHFIVTPERAARLLQDHIPFVLHLEYESSAHSVAAVGIDQAAGTLLIHDPSTPRQVEFLLEGMAKDEWPLGPAGMAMVPSRLASRLDELIPLKESRIMAAWHRHRRILETQGIIAARNLLKEMLAIDPDHPAVLFLAATQRRDEGRLGEAFVRLQQMLNKHPGCMRLRRSLLFACRDMGNTALLRNTLKDVVEKSRLPGIQAGQDWWYPPATYICQYADLLRASAASRPKAFHMLRWVIRRWYENSEAWHVLADLLWYRQLAVDTQLCYRIASCTDRNNEHYARAYCDIARAAGHEADGLQWLETRVRRRGTSPLGIEPWISWIDTLESYGYPEQALEALQEADRLHGQAPAFLAYAVSFLGRMGKWEEAEADLQRLGRQGAGLRYREAAVSFYRMRGDWATALEHARRWMEEVPQSMNARKQILDLMIYLEGPREAVDLAAHWVAKQPGHDYLEELYYQQLGSVHDSEKQIALLEQRASRNPEDGWTWRELGFLLIAEYERLAQGPRAEIRTRIDKVLAECDRTAPQEAPTLRVHAQWLEAQCQWPEALAGWLAAIESEPETFYSYRRAWEVAAGLAEEIRRDLFVRMEALLMKAVGRLHIARELIFLAAQRFGIATAEAAITRWQSQRPDDPEILEAAADLLLEYGHGRSDTERALVLLQTAVKRFPYHFDLRFSLGNALRNLGRDLKSEEVFLEIVRRHPSNAMARIRLAHIHEHGQDLEGALRWIDSALNVAPLEPEVWRVKVDLLNRCGRSAEAQTLVTKGLNLLPDSVFWREKAIDLLNEAGESEKAVAIAREGVRIFPGGAYMWFLLAKTLKHNPLFAGPGELEDCLSKALSFNQGLFEAADEWVILLAQQRRYDEAEKVLKEIMPLLSDPSPAAGRKAWLLRIKGETENARNEMKNVVHRAPWYAWGWDHLMHWLEQDKKWAETRQLLQTPIPELSADIWFRRRRLEILASADLPWKELEIEWNQLLWDYPENVALHLEYYDELISKKMTEKAAEIIRKVLPLDPESPYVLARYVEVLLNENQIKTAMDTLLKIWFTKKEESIWPAGYAWDVVKHKKESKRVYRLALQRLNRGEQPSLRALFLLADYAIRNEKNLRKRNSESDLIIVPGSGRRQLLKLLKMIDRTAWVSAEYRAILFERLSEISCYHSVRRYWEKNPAKIGSNAAAWSQVGYALVNIDKTQARDFLAHWREIPGIEMWTVTNYIYCFLRKDPEEYWEIRKSCQDALQNLPHDHNAKYLAHTLAAMNLMLNDIPAFKEAWTRYRSYFDLKQKEGEWFNNRHSYLLQDIPRLAELLDAGEMDKFHAKLEDMRRHHSLGKQAPAETTSPFQKVPVWLWIILALFLLRICTANAPR